MLLNKKMRLKIITMYGMYAINGLFSKIELIGILLKNNYKIQTILLVR